MSRNRRRSPPPSVHVLEGRCVPATFTVTNLLDDGSSGTLRSRIIAANAHPGPDTVLFRPGLTGTIRLAGGEIPIRDDLALNGPGAARVAVDGNAAGRIFNVDNGRGGADLDVTIRGLELRNGQAPFGGAVLSEENLKLIGDVIDDNRATSAGAGGVFSGSGNLTIRNSVVSGNTAASGAAGVYFYGVASPTTGFTLTIQGSTISGNTALTTTGGGLDLYGGTALIDKSVIADNTAFKYGGGIYASAAVANLTISRSTISGNQTTELNTYGYGGGIHTVAAQTTITDSTIAANIATRYGGGLFARKAVTISRSIIRDNVALNGQSGGIHEVGGSLTLTDSLVSGNRAVGGSGGGVTINSTLASTVSGCTIAGNSANGGGGVLLESQTAGVPITFRNCTITGNQAKSIGGGFEISSCNVVLHNCTIAYNLAGLSGSSTGGGIRMTQGSLTLESTIVAMNGTGGGKPDFDTGTTPVTATHCLIGSTAGAANFTGDAVTQQLLELDPLLAPLANNGGRTPTLALKAGSPCVNRGTNPDNLSTDQRGLAHARRLGLAVDIGAFERQ